MTYLSVSHVDGANERAGLLRVNSIENEVVGGGTCFLIYGYTTADCTGSFTGPSPMPVADSVKAGCKSYGATSYSEYCDASGYHNANFHNGDCEGSAVSDDVIPNGCGPNKFGAGFAKYSCGPCPSVTESSV